MKTLFSISFCMILLFFGTFKSYAQSWEARHGLTPAIFQQEFNNLVYNQGYRLVDIGGYSIGDIEGYSIAGQVEYAAFAAIWEKKPGPEWIAHHIMSPYEYQKEFDNLVDEQGYRLVDISGYSVAGNVFYAAIWEKKSGPTWEARHGLTASEYQQAFDTYDEQGFRLKRISGYAKKGKARYAAIWEKEEGPAWEARHGLTASEYQQAFDTYVEQGYRLVNVSCYNVGGKARYAGIWEKKGGPHWVARHGLNASEYQQAFDTYLQQGYRLVNISGCNIGGKARYAAIWVGGCPPVTYPWYDDFAAPPIKCQYRRFDERRKDSYQIVNGQLHITASENQDLWDGPAVGGGPAARRGAPLLLIDAPAGLYTAQVKITATNTVSPGGAQALNTQVGLFVFRDINNWMFFGLTNHDFSIDGGSIVADGLIATLTENGKSMIYHQWVEPDEDVLFLRLNKVFTGVDAQYELKFKTNQAGPWLIFAHTVNFSNPHATSEEVGMGVKTFDLSGAGVSNPGLGIFDDFLVDTYTY
ncbi:MAG: DUF1349 domain-containing protein [Planctomycetes bacterium]|nr:DUF1349 domain-containing protein [Planctomycetota bacterium]